jgi:hypothetical protein
MKRLATVLVLLVCLVCITAAAVDLHCGAVAPAGDTLVLVCRAGRMP